MTDAKRQQLIEAVRSGIENENTRQGVLEKAIKLIDGYSDRWNWTGFYLVNGDELQVGPYVGPPTPHTRIKFNQGICGAAASQKRSIIVDDVNADPRFLACSVTTKSEIVVPLMDGDTCLGEIDIDSNTLAAFSEDDRKMLEEIAAIVISKLKKL
jgi:GAF domain-containing protein